MFVCIYSATFKLMIAKFQTFAYNSRTVWPSYIKFSQQFEINELYVCTKFRGNKLRNFGFTTRKPPQRCGVKSGPIQKQLKYGKKYFTWQYVLRYPFILTYLLLQFGKTRLKLSASLPVSFRLFRTVQTVYKTHRRLS